MKLARAAVPLRLEPAKLPASQRAYLAWHIRTLLSDADLVVVTKSAWHRPADEWRAFVRGELLDLVASLEGARSKRGGG